MRIKEVEARVGLSAKNIRFYEKEGLLAPRRQAGNGYRDYDEGELSTLRRIKLLRKLDVPLEEIKAMLAGTLTLDEGMRRHLVTLESRQKNLDTASAPSWQKRPACWPRWTRRPRWRRWRVWNKRGSALSTFKRPTAKRKPTEPGFPPWCSSA